MLGILALIIAFTGAGVGFGYVSGYTPHEWQFYVIPMLFWMLLIYLTHDARE